MDAAGDEVVAGIVDSIDDDLARVLMGTTEDEWFFPVSTLPDGVVEGNAVAFVATEGRFTAQGFVGTRQTENSIEERLSRGINRRRTSEMNLADLRAAAQDPPEG